MVNMMSWNARGLGKKEKRSKFKKILRDHKVDILMLQETKKVGISDNFVRSIWGQRDFQFSEVDADGLSGGLLCIWNPAIFSLDGGCSGKNFQILSDWSGLFGAE